MSKNLNKQARPAAKYSGETSLANKRCHVISASGYGAQAVWIFENGDDHFIAVNGATDVRSR